MRRVLVGLLLCSMTSAVGVRLAFGQAADITFKARSVGGVRHTHFESANFPPYWHLLEGETGSIDDTVVFTGSQATTFDIRGRVSDGNDPEDTITLAEVSGAWPAGMTANYTTGTVTGTPAGTTGSVVVSASDGTATVNHTFNWSVTSPDVTAPAAPPAPTLVVREETSATLQVAPSSDPSGIKEYKWYRHFQETGTYTFKATTTDPEWTDTDLNVAATRYFKVEAVDNFDNVSAQSAALAVAAYVAPSANAIRFKPGHYARFGKGDSTANILSKIGTPAPNATGICAEANVKGVAVHEPWKEIQPTKTSTLNWSKFDAVIAAAGACSKYVMFRISDRCFSRTGGCTSPDEVLPTYLRTEGLTYTRTDPHPAAGLALWLPDAMDYSIDLHKILYDRYASNPWLAMVYGEETAIGQGMPASYTGPIFAAQVNRRINELRAYAPAIPFTEFFNWYSAPSNTSAMKSSFDTAVADKGVPLNGGPDGLLDAGGIDGTSDGYKNWNGTAGAMIDYRGDYLSLGNTELADWNRGATPAIVFDFYNNTMQTNYIIWYYSPESAAQGWLGDILPYIRTHPVTNTSCPPAVTQGCN